VAAGGTAAQGGRGAAHGAGRAVPDAGGAGLTGWRDVGAYVRRAIMAQRSPRATVPPLNIQAYGELARTTANLNQVTRHLNEGGQLDATTAAGLAVVLERLDGEVRALRLGLLGIKRTEESSAGASSAGFASASEQNP